MVKRLGPVEPLKACYEAGPTSYVLCWQLAELGVACEVIAPALVPMKAGDRVKTDRRDADHPSDRSSSLGWKQDQLRARHRLSKFLLRSGQCPAMGVKAWTLQYMAWVRQLRFAQAVQESTRLDYLYEVEHMGERVIGLEQAITKAVKLVSPELHKFINDLQALRGNAHLR
jgi:hypothetical protein